MRGNELSPAWVGLCLDDKKVDDGEVVNGRKNRSEVSMYHVSNSMHLLAKYFPTQHFLGSLSQGCRQERL
jgi:hypothetical protein